MIIPRTESTASRRSVNLTLLQLIMTFMMIMAIFNLAVVHKVSTITNNRSNIPARLRGEIWQRGLREEESTIAHPRALLGIFSRDDDKGYKQRQHYRTIFETVWNDDPRVCSLPRFWEKVNGPNKPLHQNDCLLVYTFVIGAHSRNDTTKPTEIVEDFRTLYDEPEQKELFVVDKISNPYSEDVNRSDVTRLNIR